MLECFAGSLPLAPLGSYLHMDRDHDIQEFRETIDLLSCLSYFQNYYCWTDFDWKKVFAVFEIVIVMVSADSDFESGLVLMILIY